MSTKIDKDELELRKWAIETTIKYGCTLDLHDGIKNMRIIKQGAKKLIKTLTVDWETDTPTDNA